MDNWTDIGIILKIERRGEKGNLLNILTNNHGRHMGWFNNFNKKQHLIHNWCDLLDIKYTNQQPFFPINYPQNKLSLQWVRPKPILLLKTIPGSW